MPGLPDARIFSSACSRHLNTTCGGRGRLAAASRAAQQAWRQAAGPGLPPCQALAAARSSSAAGRRRSPLCTAAAAAAACSTTAAAQRASQHGCRDPLPPQTAP
jgi:ferric-dicitrate binding protein FerR (iron transport regulator)